MSSVKGGINRRHVLAAIAAAVAGTAHAKPMKHIVLLGDSIFDNAAYVPGGPDVVSQLRTLLPNDCKATLHAVDGAIIDDVKRQITLLPPDATHLVLSVGGNDALRESGVLEAPARSVADALMQLRSIQDRFQHAYRSLLEEITRGKLPLAICTIYEPRFPEPPRRAAAATALAIVNDVITREAFARGLTVLDLRLISSADADFANPIEPSVQGGMKIAKVIARFAQEGDGFSRVIAR
jgi:hypothetical protein